MKIQERLSLASRCHESLGSMVLQCLDQQPGGYSQVKSDVADNLNEYVMLNICKLAQWWPVIPVCPGAPCSQAQDSVKTPSCPP